MMYQITNYDIADLKQLFIHLYEDEKYEPVIFDDNQPIHLSKKECIVGEVFKEKLISVFSNNHGQIEFVVSASNLGRIKFGNDIKQQRIQEGKEDYLVVDIEIDKVVYEILVYRIVGRIWCTKFDNNDGEMAIHHISNNGFDNRPMNLIWINKKDHDEIEKGLRSKKKRLTIAST